MGLFERLNKIKEWLIKEFYEMRYTLWILPLVLGVFFQFLGWMTIGDWISYILVHFVGLTLIVYDLFIKDANTKTRRKRNEIC